MKKSLMATLVAASMLSPLAFAAEPVELSTAQMDTVTAGQDFNFAHFNVNIAPTVQILNQVAVAVNTGLGSATAANVGGIANDVHQH